MRIEIIKFNTPKKLQLSGFYLGKKNSETIYIFIHGLGSSVFKKLELYQHLVGKNSGVLAFNNRGSEIISRFTKIKDEKNNNYQSKIIGSAHERFSDSSDDITGAVLFAKSLKPKKIILVGHSTGCQKIIYYLARDNFDRKIKGAVLLSPISDLAGLSNICDKNQYRKALNYSTKLVKNKQGHQLLPHNIWPFYIDGQRFLSLYSKNSQEEIFCYSQNNKSARTLRKVRLLLYIIIGADDKYLDRQANDLVFWFNNQLSGKKYKIEIISQAGHSFNNFEKLIAFKIKNYFKFI
jgi:pimeloyl-ACP methyl ester carboxylesterase